jgi:High-temperature-induced dauer-formation protein
LNCIRVLTRVLPFVYEKESLEDWEERFFWGKRRCRKRRARNAARRGDVEAEVLFDGSAAPSSPSPERLDSQEHHANSQDPADEFEDAKPLAEELLDTLIDLLFYSSFTLPQTSPGKPKVPYSIWQSGVGCHTSIPSTKEYESNRAEVLRLLLVMCSKSLYMRPDVVVAKGVRSITYLTTSDDKQVVLSVLCSLLNTCLKWNPASWTSSALRVVPVEQLGLSGAVGADTRELLVSYCLQFLLVLIVYAIPETQHNVPPKNFYRHFLGRLHRPQDFQFLVDGMSRILNQPLQASTSYLPGTGNSKSVQTQAPEMLMLFWECLQCNKRFRSFIIDTDRSHDFIIVTLFYAMDNRNDAAKQGLVRMCVFILQTLSVERNFGKSLNKRFEGQESLPSSIRIPNFHGSYADYLITSIHTLLTVKSTNGQRSNLEAIYPALLAILNNVAPHVENLGRATSSKFLQLFSTMARPEFLLANETNHQLLQSLLEALNAIIEHQFSKNPNLVYALLRSKRRFEALREFTLESGQEELARLQKERDEAASNSRAAGSRAGSMDSVRSPVSRTGTGLSNVPEEHSAFVIGDDEEDEDEAHAESRPLNRSHPSHSVDSSRAASVSSATDDVPAQLRGMSEKARGKMPIGTPSFSRQNSTSSLHSLAPMPSLNTGAGGWRPNGEWVS